MRIDIKTDPTLQIAVAGTQPTCVSFGWADGSWMRLDWFGSDPSEPEEEKEVEKEVTKAEVEAFNDAVEEREEVLVENAKTAAERILSERNRPHHSQSVLAQKVGVSQMTISKWESGERFPSQERFEALARVFGVDIEYLKGEQDERKRDR